MQMLYCLKELGGMGGFRHTIMNLQPKNDEIALSIQYYICFFCGPENLASQ